MKNKGTILYAEDDPTIRNGTIRNLDYFFPDNEIESFEDGTSLQNKLEELILNPDSVKLVITDKNMPGINGDEIIERYSKKLGIPFLLVYGGDNYIGEEAIKNGAYDYRIKPVDFFELSGLIEKALKLSEK